MGSTHEGYPAIDQYIPLTAVDVGTPSSVTEDPTSAHARNAMPELFTVDPRPPSAPTVDEGVDVHDTVPSVSGDDALPPPITLGSRVDFPSADGLPVHVAAEVDGELSDDVRIFVDDIAAKAREVRSTEKKDEGRFRDEAFLSLMNGKNAVSDVVML